MRPQGQARGEIATAKTFIQVLRFYLTTSKFLLLLCLQISKVLPFCLFLISNPAVFNLSGTGSSRSPEHKQYN